MTDKFIPMQVSLCESCYCVTHTLDDGRCGKCKRIKLNRNKSNHQGNICCKGCYQLGLKDGKIERNVKIIEIIKNKIELYKKLKYNQKGYPVARIMLRELPKLIKQIENKHGN
jgi:hypothetical protein